MNLLELAEEMRLEPHKTSASHGGEYHCSCPSCGGTDRFMFWPEKDRYWCRQCKAKGDAIQFCRDFQQLSFKDACIKMNQEGKKSRSCYVEKRPAPEVKVPTLSWKEKAISFIESAHQRLLIDPTAMELVLKRGLSLETIKKNQLGWNPTKIFHRYSDWGLEEAKWICLPPGIVIPLLSNNSLQKVKIRKSEWQEGNLYGKYYEVPGSASFLPLLGDPSIEITVIVEAEFDAMLVIQEAGDICNCIALGGAQKKPQLLLQEWLATRKLILFALDFDEAGKREYASWAKNYPNLEPWPVPEEKSPGDAYHKGVSLREWIKSGLQNYLK